MTKEATHYTRSDETGYITINDRSYVAKRKFRRFRGVGHKLNVEQNGFERNAKGEILYALPGTDKTATERELSGG